MSTATDLIEEYNTYISAEMWAPDTTREAVLARFADYLTDDFVLFEPASVPWGGEWNGPGGLYDFFQKFAGVAAGSGLVPVGMSGVEAFEDGDVVLRQLSFSYGPTSAFPEGFSYKMIEKYILREGRIAVIDEYYADTAALLGYFESLPGVS